ncbi:flavin reductase family protein [Natronomonas sp. EA1]|uniref:flavin reductase family protein n=1 Tax=Natronomonas sp. EA1 TaxID=3421655 RepID=UPI003EBBF47D
MDQVHGTPDAFGSPYRLLSGAVVPRPIAWVGTQNSEGKANLAPYSFFNVVSADPPIVMFAPFGQGDDRKDTAVNVMETGECVIHVVTESTVEAMNETAATLAPDEDEFEHAGLERAPTEVVDAPRVADARVAFECTLHDAQEVGGSMLIMAEVVHVHLDEELLTEGKFDTEKLDAIGRLAGGWYARLSDRFELERPP